ncbi:MAG: hypothetical protein RL660_1431 [Bacteroidota bacterium]|jgi:hypothetical protein
MERHKLHIAQMKQYIVHNINWTRYFNLDNVRCFTSEVNRDQNALYGLAVNLLSIENEIIFRAQNKLLTNEIELFDNLGILSCTVKKRKMSLYNEVIARTLGGDNVIFKADKILSCNSSIYINKQQIGFIEQVSRNSFTDCFDKEEYIIELDETDKTSLIFAIIANTIFSYTEYD